MKFDCSTGDHSTKEVIRRHFDQRNALDIPSHDEVETHVDAAGVQEHRQDVLLDSLLIKGIEYSPFRRPPFRRDLIHQRIELLLRSAHEKNLGTVACEGSSYAAADSTAATVNDRVRSL